MERSSRVGDALLEAKGEHGAMEAKLQVRLIDHCGSTFCKGQPLGRQLVTDAGWLHAVGPASAHLCAWIVCQILASPQDVCQLILVCFAAATLRCAALLTQALASCSTTSPSMAGPPPV